MSTPTQNRRPPGSPVGGQFAETSRAETDLDLADGEWEAAMAARVQDRRDAYREAERRLDEAHWQLQKSELALLSLSAPPGATHIRVLTTGDDVDDDGGHERETDAWVDADGEEVADIHYQDRVSWSSRRDSLGHGYFELVDNEHPLADIDVDECEYVPVASARAELDREVALS